MTQTLYIWQRGGSKHWAKRLRLTTSYKKPGKAWHGPSRYEDGDAIFMRLVPKKDASWHLVDDPTGRVTLSPGAKLAYVKYVLLRGDQ